VSYRRPGRRDRQDQEVQLGQAHQQGLRDQPDPRRLHRLTTTGRARESESLKLGVCDSLCILLYGLLSQVKVSLPGFVFWILETPPFLIGFAPRNRTVFFEYFSISIGHPSQLNHHEYTINTPLIKESKCHFSHIDRYFFRLL
jgi:hypothetical protein